MRFVVAFAFADPAGAAPPITLEHVWGRLADPAGEVNSAVRNGIVSGESAEFSKDGRYIATTSKADGRTSQYANAHLTGATSHLRLFDLQGNLLWDVARSRGPINPATGRPSDQPASGEDELEVAVFSRCDTYLAAGGDDAKIEIWRYRDPVTREVLSAPVLAKTFLLGGGIDSMFYSHAGDLLFAGSEEAGKVEVFRTQGEPDTWRFLHKADHGGTGSNGVNSVALTQDDLYVASVGTNQRGVLWRLDALRDAVGLVTSVNLVRLATLAHATSTLREVRFQPVGLPLEGRRREILAITAEHDQATRIYDLQDVLDLGDPASGPLPFQTLRNFNTSVTAGNPVEPLAFTRDGRFLLVPGKTRDAVLPAFLRLYETAEIRKDAPEPDPVFVQHDQVRNPEYFDFSPDGARLTSSHHDGSVRLWNVAVGGSVTIASEGFNETTTAAGRWTLEGPASTTSGGNRFGSVGQVGNFTGNFRGHRGGRFVAIDGLGGISHTLSLNRTWSRAGYRDVQIHFAAAAATGVWENDDFLRLEADTDGDGVFEVLIAEFRSDNPAHKDLALVGGSPARRLDLTFADFVFDLAPLLPPGAGTSLRLRLSASTGGTDEEIAFDSLRLTGVPLPPALTASPASRAVEAGHEVAFSVVAEGLGPFGYQWYRDGVAIPGATGATLLLPSAQRFHAGAYTVRVSNALGTVTSPAASLAVAPPSGGAARLVNLSTRAVSLSGDNVLIPGFVVTGSGPRPLLIRVVGPTLGRFGVEGVLENPRLQLKLRGPQGFVDVAANDDWGSNANAAEIAALTPTLGAFDLVPGGADAALLAALAPGGYTVVADGVGGTTGIALVEIYDVPAGTGDGGLVNLSSRAYVGPGAQAPIQGFVVAGAGARTLLIRAIGPTLARFDVAGFLPDPRLTVFRGGVALFGNDDWGAGADANDTAMKGDQVGAFTLPEGGKDAALVVSLTAGEYTVVVSDTAGVPGVALMEVYLVP